MSKVAEAYDEFGSAARITGTGTLTNFDAAPVI
jgi:hypothetical protein